MAYLGSTLFYFMAFVANARAFQPPAGQSEFIPSSQLPPTDQLPAAPLLIAAYAFVWVAIAFYLWTIWRRLGKVEADMRALEQRRSQRSAAR
jgi:CcmD family protein